MDWDSWASSGMMMIKLVEAMISGDRVKPHLETNQVGSHVRAPSLVRVVQLGVDLDAKDQSGEDHRIIGTIVDRGDVRYEKG